jgi:hypothetical protein
MICQLKIVLDNETGPNITKFGYYHNAFGWLIGLPLTWSSTAYEENITI